MRVATWNIGSGFTYNETTKQYDRDDLHYFIEALKRIDADVVCLQECGEKQAQTIAQALGMHCAYDVIHQDHLRGGKMYLAILCKERLTNAKMHRFTHPVLDGENELHDKGILVAKAVLEQKTVTLLSGHLFAFHHTRKSEDDPVFKPAWQELQNFILGFKGSLIASMDLNTEKIGLLPEVLEHGYQDAIVGITTPDAIKHSSEHLLPAKQTDHILYSRDWHVMDSKIQQGKAAHYVAWVDLE